MFRHNILTIYRNFKKYKTTFFINLIGLTIGLTCTLLIYLWIYSELSVDKFHLNVDRLYQVMENQQLSKEIVTQAETPDLLAETLVDDMPEIQYATAVMPPAMFGDFILTSDNIQFKEKGQFAGTDYFKMFSFELEEGDPAEVLQDKNSIVISRGLAQRLFKQTEKLIGKTVECEMFDQKSQYTVSGVFADLPSNSTEDFDFVLPFHVFKDLSLRLGRPLSWGNHGPSTYLVLKEGADEKTLNRKIKDFIKQRDTESNVSLFLRPYASAYLYGKYVNGIQVGGRIEYVWLFSLVAFFILVMACINFMNLSTAKASRRVKEVGVKKAIGAERSSLVYQYLGESMLLTFISLCVALFLVFLLLPYFNYITGQEVALRFDGKFIAALLGITVITGLLSGSYPAAYLSSFNPAVVLKGSLNNSGGEMWIRKGLVVFQFTLSVILIVSVMVIYNQIDYIQHKNLGYSKDNVIYFAKEGKVADNLETFLQEIKKIPGVLDASSIAQTIVGSSSYTGDVSWEGKDPNEIVNFRNVRVNYDMIETLGMQMKAGRSFSRQYGNDEQAIIFNEAALDVIGLSDPLNKKVRLWGEEREIIGIVQNFHFDSFYEDIKPLFMSLNPAKTMLVMAKIKSDKEQEAIQGLKRFYKQFTGNELSYRFLDADYQAQYVAENRVAALSRYFAGLAIIISCLGLFGLAAFSAERRVKEIGIRKVLGASNFNVAYYLSKNFAELVLLALVIALPVSYLISRSWLDGFVYSIDLKWWFFLNAGCIALLIAILTVGAQTLKAAWANPIDCLRSE